MAKRVEGIIWKSLKPVRLFRDDLEEIESLLKEHGFVAKVSDAEYEYESLGEFFDKRRVWSKGFKIGTQFQEIRGADITICFNDGPGGGCRIHCMWPDMHARIAIQQLEDLLSRRFRRLPKLVIGVGAVVPLVVIGVLLLQREFSVAVFAAALSISYFAFLFMCVDRMRSIIETRVSSDKPAFLEAHGSELLAATVSAVVSAILTGVISWLLLRD